MAEFVVNPPGCLIEMDASGGSHYSARKLQGFGHTVKLMAAHFVKTNKNDAADAEEICAAVARPNMRFVLTKDVDVFSVNRVQNHNFRHFESRRKWKFPDEHGNIWLRLGVSNGKQSFLYELCRT